MPFCCLQKRREEKRAPQRQRQRQPPSSSSLSCPMQQASLSLSLFALPFLTLRILMIGYVCMYGMYVCMYDMYKYVEPPSFTDLAPHSSYGNLPFPPHNPNRPNILPSCISYMHGSPSSRTSPHLFQPKPRYDTCLVPYLTYLPPA